MKKTSLTWVFHGLHGWQSSVPCLADRPRTPARVLVLGSADPRLVRGVSESLAGRVAHMDLAGFDLAELGVRIPAVTLGRFWNMIAHYHGGVWNSAEFARALGSSEPTARHYLDLLSGAWAVRQLPPWFVQPGQTPGPSSQNLHPRRVLLGHAPGRGIGSDDRSQRAALRLRGQALRCAGHDEVDDGRPRGPGIGTHPDRASGQVGLAGSRQDRSGPHCRVAGAASDVGPCVERLLLEPRAEFESAG